MIRFSVRSASLFAAVVVATACGAPWTGRVAYAGCGDYVHVGGIAPHHSMSGDDLVAQLESIPSKPVPRSEHRPCQGPSCSQVPFEPHFPAPLVLSKVIDQKACLVCDSVLAHAACGWSRCETDRSLVESLGLRIERPPRHCLS